ncbi:TPR-like protein [Apiospora aurea]|uniref:TPR-like protein n=1 Tax=Apiospora aurea TaxID=335848 RepID=A0ABR1Q8F1_9PEZI
MDALRARTKTTGIYEARFQMRALSIHIACNAVEYTPGDVFRTGFASDDDDHREQLTPDNDDHLRTAGGGYNFSKSCGVPAGSLMKLGTGLGMRGRRRLAGSSRLSPREPTLSMPTAFVAVVLATFLKCHPVVSMYIVQSASADHDSLVRVRLTSRNKPASLSTSGLEPITTIPEVESDPETQYEFVDQTQRVDEALTSYRVFHRSIFGIVSRTQRSHTASGSGCGSRSSSQTAGISEAAVFAEVQVKNVKDFDDAANTMVDAFKAYKQEPPESAVRVLEFSIRQYCKAGDLGRSGRCRCVADKPPRGPGAGLELLRSPCGLFRGSVSPDRLWATIYPTTQEEMMSTWVGLTVSTLDPSPAPFYSKTRPGAPRSWTLVPRPRGGGRSSLASQPAAYSQEQRESHGTPQHHAHAQRWHRHPPHAAAAMLQIEDSVGPSGAPAGLASSDAQ